MSTNGPVIRKTLINGEWVTQIIKNPPKTPKPKKVKKKHLKKLIKSGKFYNSYEWAKLRYEVLKESNGCCELCGRSAKDGVKLVVDHIKPRHKYPLLRFEKSNLQVLCRTCNWGKYGNEETDWRFKNKPKPENELDWIDNRDWPGLTLVK